MPFCSQGLHPTDPATRGYGPDAFYTGGEPRPRGCCGTTVNVWSLDAMARYELRLGRSIMNVRVDVFNLFDNRAVVRVDENGELGNGEANPTWGEAIEFQNPRRVRFGIGFSF